MSMNLNKLLKIAEKQNYIDFIQEDEMYPAINYKDRYPVSVICPNINDGPWIAGGAPICWYNNSSVELQDIDVWCKNKEQEIAVIKRLTENFATIQLSTRNAVTFILRQDDQHSWKIQVITKQCFESIRELFDYFDITVCKIATDGGRFYFADDGVVRDLNSKTLRFVTEQRINAQRMMKYIFYGYKPLKSQLDYLRDTILDNKNNPLDQNYDDMGII